MNCRVTHRFLQLLVIFCIANLRMAEVLNTTWTFPTSTEIPPTSASVNHTPSVEHVVTPAEVLGASTFTVVQQTSTLEHNSSKSWNNNSEVTSAANFSGSSSSSLESFTMTSWRDPGNISNASTDLVSGNSSTTFSSAAWTTDQPTGIRNESKLSQSPSTNKYLTNFTNHTARTMPDVKTQNGTYTTTIYGAQVKLKHPEAILTIAFSIILFTVLLVILVYSLNKCRSRRRQYSHRPLDDTSYDSVNQHSTPEDTLVISGGLYDPQRVYNPNMTVLEDEECQPDYLSFASRPGQFRLEFLPGEKETETPVNSADFNSFHLPNHSL